MPPVLAHCCSTSPRAHRAQRAGPRRDGRAAAMSDGAPRAPRPRSGGERAGPGRRPGEGRLAAGHDVLPAAGRRLGGHRSRDLCQRRSRQPTAAEATSPSASVSPRRSPAARARCSVRSALAMTAGPVGPASRSVRQLGAGQLPRLAADQRRQLTGPALGRRRAVLRGPRGRHGRRDRATGLGLRLSHRRRDPRLDLGRARPAAPSAVAVAAAPLAAAVAARRRAAAPLRRRRRAPRRWPCRASPRRCRSPRSARSRGRMSWCRRPPWWPLRAGAPPPRRAPRRRPRGPRPSAAARRASRVSATAACAWSYAARTRASASAVSVSTCSTDARSTTCTRSRRQAGTTLALARPTGARARVAQQVLGTRRHDARPPATRPLQLGDATLQGAHALVGLQQRLVDAAGSLRRALLNGRDARLRPGGGADRSGGAPGPPHARRRRTTRRTGAWRRWSRARSRRGTARRAIPARASGPATGSSRPSTAARRKRSFHSRIFSMMVSRVQRVTRRPPAVFADGGISELRSASSRSAAC